MNIVEQVNIQELLKVERQKRSMTYEDVASALGCSASYVFRIEKGKRKKPSYEIVSKMINFFDLTNEELKNYIDGELALEINQSELLQQDLLNFIIKMDVNNFTEVQQLLQKVQEYQHSSNVEEKQVVNG